MFQLFICVHVCMFLCQCMFCWGYVFPRPYDNQNVPMVKLRDMEIRYIVYIPPLTLENENSMSLNKIIFFNLVPLSAKWA